MPLGSPDGLVVVSSISIASSTIATADLFAFNKPVSAQDLVEYQQHQRACRANRESFDADRLNDPLGR